METRTVTNSSRNVESEKVADTTSTWKSLVEDFLDYTTTHGLPHTKRVQHLAAKLMWFTLSLASFCYVIYQIDELYDKYNALEVEVKVGIHVSRIKLFPAVTICNVNAYR